MLPSLRRCSVAAKCSLVLMTVKIYEAGEGEILKVKDEF